MRRATFLKGAAGALVGAGVALGASPRRARAATLDVTKIKDLTGPGLTTAYSMEATDLGVPTRTPDGRLLFVFGDTWQYAHALTGGWWRAPVALWSNTANLDNGVVWSGAVGGSAAQQLWPYAHTNNLTMLPSDVITIGGTIYLHVMVNEPFPTVTRSEIWKSDDNGATWQFTGATFPGNAQGGLFQCITWGEGNDGYVYVYSTRFGRNDPIILTRVRTDQLTNPAAYEPWGYLNGAWAWGNPATPILTGKFGELCLRPLGGKWVFTWFDAGDYRIDGILMDTPTSNLYTAYRQTLLWGTGWGQEDGSHVAQLYGGYIIPGSTIDELHLSVSQWNTQQGADNWPYHVMQFRVRGFGS